MTIRREKKVGNINVHLPSATELRVRRLAEASGTTASQYLQAIIDQHLSEKHREHMVLRGVFDDEGSVGSFGSIGSGDSK